MDVLLLGAAAILLLLLTIWIVWRPGVSSNASAPQQEEGPMIPQGDEFEDQYTSATADLSAGGVALAEAAAEAEATGNTSEAADMSVGDVSAPWPQDSPHPTGSATGFTRTIGSTSVEGVASRPVTKSMVVGAAALGTVSGAVGVWLYARWQRERDKPLNRLRRRLR